MEDKHDFPLAVQAAIHSVSEVYKNSVGQELHVQIIRISPWNSFVPALNALLTWSANSGADHILFVSAETSVTAEGLACLKSYMDMDTTLCVGAALPGHDVSISTISATADTRNSKRVILTGRTTPWNTLALWNVPKLTLTGFPMVGEGVHYISTKEDNKKKIEGGVEEVSTIVLLQTLLPSGTAEAKLVLVPGVEWKQRFEDEERRKWHEHKMQSKVSRPAKHLELLGLQNKGTVIHFC